MDYESDDLDKRLAKYIGTFELKSSMKIEEETKKEKEKEKAKGTAKKAEVGNKKKGAKEESDSDDGLEERLAKYMGTYDLREEEERRKVAEGNGRQQDKKGNVRGSTDDFEEYKKKLGLDLELEDDDSAYVEDRKEGTGEGYGLDSSKSVGELSARMEYADKKGESGEWDYKKRGGESEYGKKKDLNSSDEVQNKSEYNDDWEADGESDKENKLADNRKVVDAKKIS